MKFGIFLKKYLYIIFMPCTLKWCIVSVKFASFLPDLKGCLEQ